MLVTRKFGEEVWIDFFEWGGGKVKIFEFHVNADQRVISAEEDFHNQVDRMTVSFSGYQSASSLSSVSLSSGLISKVAVLARVDVTNRHSNIDFSSSRPAWLWPLLNAQSVISRD